jgi:hypothetical protein
VVISVANFIAFYNHTGLCSAALIEKKMFIFLRSLPQSTNIRYRPQPALHAGTLRLLLRTKTRYQVSALKAGSNP